MASVTTSGVTRLGSRRRAVALAASLLLLLTSAGLFVRINRTSAQTSAPAQAPAPALPNDPAEFDFSITAADQSFVNRYKEIRFTSSLRSSPNGTDPSVEVTVEVTIDGVVAITPPVLIREARAGVPFGIFLVKTPGVKTVRATQFVNGVATRVAGPVLLNVQPAVDFSIRYPVDVAAELVKVTCPTSSGPRTLQPQSINPGFGYVNFIESPLTGPCSVAISPVSPGNLFWYAVSTNCNTQPEYIFEGKPTASVTLSPGGCANNETPYEITVRRIEAPADFTVGITSPSSGLAGTATLSARSCSLSPQSAPLLIQRLCTYEVVSIDIPGAVSGSLSAISGWTLQASLNGGVQSVVLPGTLLVSEVVRVRGQAPVLPELVLLRSGVPTTVPPTTVPPTTVPPVTTTVPPTSQVRIDVPATLNFGQAFAVTVSGLKPGEYAAITDNFGETLGWAQANANGVAVLNTAAWRSGAYTISVQVNGVGPKTSATVQVNAKPTDTTTVPPVTTVPPPVTTAPPVTTVPPPVTTVPPVTTTAQPSNIKVDVPLSLTFGQSFAVTVSGLKPGEFAAVTDNYGSTLGWGQANAAGIAVVNTAAWQKGAYTIVVQVNGVGPKVSTTVQVGSGGTTAPPTTVPPTTAPPTTAPSTTTPQTTTTVPQSGIKVTVPTSLTFGQSFTVSVSGLKVGEYAAVTDNYGSTLGWGQANSNGIAVVNTAAWRQGPYTVNVQVNGTGPVTSATIQVAAKA